LPAAAAIRRGSERAAAQCRGLFVERLRLPNGQLGEFQRRRTHSGLLRRLRRSKLVLLVLRVGRFGVIQRLRLRIPALSRLGNRGWGRVQPRHVVGAR
jgi:hypothetical protein